MASACIRSMTRTSLLYQILVFKSSPPSSSIKGSAASAYRNCRFASIFRSPVELGCFDGDLLCPLHTAVAAGEAEIEAEHGILELPRSLTDGYEGM